MSHHVVNQVPISMFTIAWAPMTSSTLMLHRTNYIQVGVGRIDKFSTSVFLEKILRYYYMPTIGVADLQAPLNNMLSLT